MKGIDLGNLGNDRRLSASCHGIAHNYSYHWGHPDPYLGPRVHQPQVAGDTVSKGPLKGSALKPIQKWGDQVVAGKEEFYNYFISLIESQCTERILNKITKAINETFVGLKCALQGSKICIV